MMNATRYGQAKSMAARAAALFLATLLFASEGAHAVEPDPPTVATVATTTLDAGGRPWAYLVFDPNKPGLLTGRTFGVYVKPGTPDAATAFVFRGVAGPATDAMAINVLLSRGASIGDNLGALEAQIIGLHRLLINHIDSSTPPTNDPPSLPLNERLAALLNRAGGDTSLGQMLDMLGLAHPAVRLVRGTAWAAPLNTAVGADVTIEVRERTTAGTDGAVIARVTFKAGQPAVLPAPGPLVVVPDTTASGDLTVKLRWATPTVLRQLGTRHHGDVVWRVSRAFAEAHGFNTAPPGSASLDALTLSNSADVKRAGGPIFPTKIFATGDVADFIADATTAYFTDNNDRYAAGGVALVEGAQYYYFVAGADALGKPGAVSAGALATVCRRVPPHVPSHLAVTNAWTSATAQYLDVKWLTNALGDGTGTTTYEIFRGNDLAAHAAAQRGELDLNATPIVAGSPASIARIAIVPDPGAAVQQTLDVVNDGGGLPANAGKTWWFAVRAVHQGPPGCGDVASALSPPIFGSLRDRTSPPAPDANTIAPPVIDCLRIACINDVPAASTVSGDPLDPSVLQFTAQCTRRAGIADQNGVNPPGTATNHGIIAAHFHVMDGATEVVPETIVVFPDDADTVEYSWTLPLAQQTDSLDVQCRAESPTGSESPTGYLSAWAHSVATGVDPTGDHFMLHHFLAGAISQSDLDAGGYENVLLFQSIAAEPVPWPADLHLAFSPETGRVFHPQFKGIPFPASAEQYRVYRRVEDGPLTLVGQGLKNGAASFDFEDHAPPIWNGHVHYFTQMLDESGRASAMRRLGSLRFTGDKPPTPVLLTPKPADFGGTAAAPTVTLSWICPPEHVDRFEVFFNTVKPSTGGGSGIGISALANLLLRTATPPTVHTVKSKSDREAKIIARLDESFLTGKVGGNFGAGPQFSVTMNLDPNLQYTVWLRALGPGGEQGDASRSLPLQWQAPVAPPANVAWPARPLPPVGAFNPGITAVDFRDFDPLSLIWKPGVQGEINQFGVISVFPDLTPVGIHVGSVTATFASAEHYDTATFLTGGTNGVVLSIVPSISPLLGLTDPNTQLYRHATNAIGLYTVAATERLLPCVLYRQQVANAAFPTVSGDVIQASPLISKVAWIPYASNGNSGAQLVDPFFRWVHTNVGNVHTFDLYLVDTQPVVTGALYRYWLMRFNALGEPIQTIPCGEVTIEPAP